MIYDYDSTQRGWVCPICGKALAPWMSECDCNHYDIIIKKTITNVSDGDSISVTLVDKCPLFKCCNMKTAVCRIKEPDSSCWYYRYFKKLINEQGDDKNVL